MDLSAFAQSVREAAQRPEVRDAVTGAYLELERRIQIRKPICVVSGKCCRFEEYGHRLYVTTMELAAFLHEFQATPQSEKLAQSISTWNGTGCPFQIAKLCGVHAFRPLGCRMFFCDATSTEWQNEQYEIFHAQLKRMHESLEVPYNYVEWRAALKAVVI